MKRKSFLLFLTSAFIATPLMAQNVDLPLFESTDATSSADPCPTCTKPLKAASVPNIGKDARPVDSVKLVPAPFPPISVTMSDNEDADVRPFAGREMKYGARVTPAAAYNNSGASKQGAPVMVNPADIQVAAKKMAPPEVQNELSKMQKAPTGSQPASSATVKSPKAPTVSKAPTAAKPSNLQPFGMPTQIGALSSAASFNIADLRLGMSPDDVIDTAAENGFEISNVAYGIPSFMVTDFERECRADGLYQTRLIHECVRERARSEDVYYISQLTLKKPMTKEQIVVLFSSGLTDNQAFKIDYTGFGDNSLGTSYKDLLKKTNRRDVFWKYVAEKYGRPAGNNSFWGNPNSVYMRAFLDGNALDARITLEDVTQKGTDYREAESLNKQKDVDNPFSF